MAQLTAIYAAFAAVPDDWEYETVSREDVQRLINDLADELAPSTVKHVFTIISRPLKDGRLYGYTDRSDAVCSIRLPAMGRKSVNALSHDQLSAVLKELPTSDYAGIYTVLLNTGMRFCELAGLNNGDIDFKNATVRIERNFYRGRLYKSTKTAASVRDVPLNFAALSVFKQNIRIGIPKQPLFCSKRGSRLSYNTLVHDWHRLLDRAGVARCGLHVLRHTFATQLLAADVSLKVASALLGHESIAITADIYMDVPLQLKRNAVDVLAFGA